VIFVSRMETVVYASTIHTHRDITRHVMIENATKNKQSSPLEQTRIPKVRRLNSHHGYAREEMIQNHLCLRRAVESDEKKV
jgi:hypothetical protein